MTKPTFIIAGAGQAGGQAVRELRRLGFDGTLVLVGAEKHYPYERPPLSKNVLLDPAIGPTFLGSESEFEENHVEFLSGTTLEAIDRNAREVALSHGQRRKYDRLLIATGSKLRKLTIPGLDPSQITYLRTLDDSRDLEAKLRKKPRVAIVGGGFIGLEVAATARQMGCAVCVIEASPVLLPRLQCPAISEAVQSFHENTGVTFYMGATIERAETGTVALKDGRNVDVDIVFAGIGVVPDDAVAQEAGLKVNDGILVDELCRTSDPSIFAAGDVTRQYHPVTGNHVRLESWENANLQGIMAAKSMMGSEEDLRSRQAPWVWSDQGSLNLQIAGFPDETAETVLRRFPDEADSLVVFQLSHGRVTAVMTCNRGRDMVLLRRLVGADVSHLSTETLADATVSVRDLVRGK